MPAVVVPLGAVAYVAFRYGLGVDSSISSTARTLVICVLAAVLAAALAFLVVTIVRSVRATGGPLAGAARSLLALSGAVVVAVAGLATIVSTVSIAGRIPAHFRGAAYSDGIVVRWDANPWATGGYEVSVDSDQSTDFRLIQGTTYTMPNDAQPHTFYVYSLHSPGQTNSFTARLSCPAVGTCVPVANPYVTG